MAVEIFMPQLGLTMIEGTVVRWLKAPGDPVSKGEPLFEVETDKVTEEIEAAADGIMGPILVEEGVPKPIAFVLGHILAPGEQPPGAAPPAAPDAPGAAVPAGAAALPMVEQGEAPLQGGPFASPRARVLAAKLNIDLAGIEASGPGGRIVEADVRWHADRQPPAAQLPVLPAPATPVAARLAQKLGVDLSRVQGSGPAGQIVKEDVERAAAERQAEAVPSRPSEAERTGAPTAAMVGDLEPLRGVRRVVAERMAHSFATAPHFYLSVEVEATELLRLRERLLPRVEATTGVRLTVTDILIQACAQALGEFPAANSAWDESQGGGVRRQPGVNIGLAVGLEDGLLVPVLHRADELSLAEIARRRADLVSRAQAGKLALADLEGGTFTLSNLGMFGIDQFEAILNPPQAAILAVGRVKDRPVAHEGVVLVRPTMYLTLSVDHRLLDGAQAARFLERVAQRIEDPYLLLA